MLKERVTAEELKECLRQHPSEFSMGTWGCKTECGTTACIAGWTLILAGYEIVPESNMSSRFVGNEIVEDIPSKAAELLGIEPDKFGGYPLFFRSTWPDDLFDAATADDVTPSEVVEIACQAIDYFLPQQ